MMDTPRASTEEARRHAADYARSAIDGFARLLIVALVTCASLWLLLLSTKARDSVKLRDHKTVLYAVSLMDHIRYDLSQEVAKAIFGHVSISNDRPFAEYTIDNFSDLHSDDQPFRRFYVKGDASQRACLDKLLDPTNELRASLRHPPTFISPDKDLPYSLLGDGSDIGALEAVTSDHAIQLVDPRMLNEAIFTTIDAIVSEAEVASTFSRVFPFDHDGFHPAISAGGSPPYEVDPKFAFRRDTTPIAHRRLAELSPPLGRVFCAANFKLIDKARVLTVDAVELRLRFSSSRPQMLKGNAFEDEDSPSFMLDDRWPLVTWAKGQLMALRTNPYGDLYLLIRLPFLSVTVKAPLGELPILEDQAGIPSDIVQRARAYAQELKVTEDKPMSLEKRMATGEADLAGLQSGEADAGGIKVPLKWVLPVSGVAVLALALLLGYHVLRLRRMFSSGLLLPSDLVFLSSPLLRRGLAGSATRGALIFPSIGLAAAVLYSSSTIYDIRPLLEALWFSGPLVGLSVGVASIALLAPLVRSVSEAEEAALGYLTPIQPLPKAASEATDRAPGPP